MNRFLLKTMLYSIVNLVHAVIDTFVHSLDSVMNINLTLNLISLVLTYKSLNLLNKFSGFSFGNEFR